MAGEKEEEEKEEEEVVVGMAVVVPKRTFACMVPGAQFAGRMLPSNRKARGTKFITPSSSKVGSSRRKAHFFTEVSGLIDLYDTPPLGKGRNDPSPPLLLLLLLVLLMRVWTVGSMVHTLLPLTIEITPVGSGPRSAGTGGRGGGSKIK
jgi:hypothetical protein